MTKCDVHGGDVPDERLFTLHGRTVCMQCSGNYGLTEIPKVTCFHCQKSFPINETWSSTNNGLTTYRCLACNWKILQQERAYRDPRGMHVPDELKQYELTLPKLVLGMNVFPPKTEPTKEISKSVSEAVEDLRKKIAEAGSAKKAGIIVLMNRRREHSDDYFSAHYLVGEISDVNMTISQEYHEKTIDGRVIDVRYGIPVGIPFRFIRSVEYVGNERTRRKLLLSGGKKT